MKKISMTNVASIVTLLEQGGKFRGFPIGYAIRDLSMPRTFK